jgi:hypothetical protein
VDRTQRGLSRRDFVGLTAGAALVISAGPASAWQRSGSRHKHDRDHGHGHDHDDHHHHDHHDDDAFIEADIPELQRLMRRREMSSQDLTQAYLDRIEQLNPLLAAVLEVNPDALDIARDRDDERRDGSKCGALHGIPVLLKDNIATADRLQTTLRKGTHATPMLHHRHW